MVITISEYVHLENAVAKKYLVNGIPSQFTAVIIIKITLDKNIKKKDIAQNMQCLFSYYMN